MIFPGFPGRVGTLLDTSLSQNAIVVVNVVQK